MLMVIAMSAPALHTGARGDPRIEVGNRVIAPATDQFSGWPLVVARPVRERTRAHADVLGSFITSQEVGYRRASRNICSAQFWAWMHDFLTVIDERKAVISARQRVTPPQAAFPDKLDEWRCAAIAAGAEERFAQCDGARPLLGGAVSLMTWTAHKDWPVSRC